MAGPAPEETPGAVIASVVHFGAMCSRRSEEELLTLAHIKRFLELVTGDLEFRESLKSLHDDLAAAQALVAARAIDLDLARFGPVFGINLATPVEAGRATEFPLAKLWGEWIRELLAFRRMIRDDGYSGVADPRFNAWRRRQVERVNLEMGSTRADAITHPIVSFELSRGCSVRCWFCGLDAAPLSGVFARTADNVRLWRDTLRTTVELFGPAAQTGFCYWATEPADNPHYLDFLEDYREIVGVVPQTTSALPVRDLGWTRRLLALHRRPPALPSRFSIVSVDVLRALHAAFTPEELLRYELLMQQKESSYAKARAGRTLRSRDRKRERAVGLQVGADASTIACVSGFLVNMLDRSVQLVSPSRATRRWPLGFRIHAEGRFDTARDYGDFVTHAIAEHMPAALPPDRPVAFREQLEFVPIENGFAVGSGLAERVCSGNEYARELGQRIAEGVHRPGEIVAAMVNAGHDVFAVAGTLQELFDLGILEDLPEEPRAV